MIVKVVLIEAHELMLFHFLKIPVINRFYFFYIYI